MRLRTAHKRRRRKANHPKPNIKQLLAIIETIDWDKVGQLLAAGLKLYLDEFCAYMNKLSEALMEDILIPCDFCKVQLEGISIRQQDVANLDIEDLSDRLSEKGWLCRLEQTANQVKLLFAHYDCVEKDLMEARKSEIGKEKFPPYVPNFKLYGFHLRPIPIFEVVMNDGTVIAECLYHGYGVWCEFRKDKNYDIDNMKSWKYLGTKDFG